jgi:hypothetical protein
MAATSFSLIARGQSFSMRISSVSIEAVSTVSLVEFVLETGALRFVSTAAGLQPLKMIKENTSEKTDKNPFRVMIHSFVTTPKSS